MNMTIDSDVASALTSLNNLEKACCYILDLEVGYPPQTLLHPMDVPDMTLRDAIDYCRDTLTTQLIHIEQGEAAEHLSQTFSEVAHNLTPSILRQAIRYLHGTVESLTIVEQALVRLKVEARLFTACELPVQDSEQPPQLPPVECPRDVGGYQFD